jgi:tRNA-dihydrouridine synthase B
MKIGSIELDRALLLAPMEDVTDLPFRLICKRLGADIVYTEFVNSEGLVRGSRKTRSKMLFREEERPFGIQLYGGEPESMFGAARLAESMGPDLIDINCGCWVRDIALRGAGAGLLRDLPKMERIVSAVVKAVRLPVTLKTRLGWDAHSIRIVDVAKMCEQAGIAALTVHCRTRDQGHTGTVDYTWIPHIKEAVSIPVIVNGDILSPQDVRRVFDSTGCDGIMVGRGAMLNPWIFGQARYFLNTGELLPEAGIRDRVALLREHLDLSVEYKGERTGVLELRKHYSGYLRGFPNITRVRADLMQFNARLSIISYLDDFLHSLSEEEECIPHVPDASGDVLAR